MAKCTWTLRVGLAAVNLVLVNSLAAQAAPEVMPLPPAGNVEPWTPSTSAPTDDERRPQHDSGPPANQAVATIVVDSSFAREHEPSAHDHTAASQPNEGEATRIHGLRLGYVAMLNYDEPTDANDPESSPKEKLGLNSPHSFVLGYEVAQRIIGGGWLDILLIANATVVGLEQSKFMPNANMLVGFEFRKSFQAGVGINLAPVKDKSAHMILAAGWTPSSGELLLPVHVFLIPDVDGNHRIGSTVGVNWEI